MSNLLFREESLCDTYQAFELPVSCNWTYFVPLDGASMRIPPEAGFTMCNFSIGPLVPIPIRPAVPTYIVGGVIWAVTETIIEPETCRVAAGEIHVDSTPSRGSRFSVLAYDARALPGT
jgi:hypothetical protein